MLHPAYRKCILKSSKVVKLIISRKFSRILEILEICSKKFSILENYQIALSRETLIKMYWKKINDA